MSSDNDYLTFPSNEPTSTLSEAEVATIRSQLPDDWTEEEVNNFLSQFGTKVANGVTIIPDEEPRAAEEPEMVIAQEVVRVSRMSRSGLTMGSTILLDGRNVSLQDIWDAGQLVALPIRHLTEGSRQRPIHVVQYEARVVDRPRFFVVTEQTYRTISRQYPQNHPHPEELTDEQLKKIQATVTVMQPDQLDGRKTNA